MNKISKNLTNFIVFFLIIFSPIRTGIAAIDEFSPYVKARIMYDSNLFRYSDDANVDELLQGGSKDDTVTYLGAGFTSDIKLSRQHLLFDLDLDRAMYRNYDKLDHTYVNGSALWSWLAGNLWSGTLGYKYKQELSSFNELNIPVKDMRTKGTTFFNVGYQIHPDWRIDGEVSLLDVTYDVRKYLDRKTRTGQLEVKYRNTLNTQVGIQLRYSDHILGSEINDFVVNEISGVFYWQGSGKSALEARIGYLDINYEFTKDRNFQGVSADLIYHWIITGKTSMDISAWREPSSKNNEIATYVLSQGVSVKPMWSVTRVINIEAEFMYENDDFKAGVVVDGQQRSDDTLLMLIRANWDPRRNLRLSLGYRKENRDSNFEFRDFNYNQIDIKAQFIF